MKIIDKDALLYDERLPQKLAMKLISFDQTKGSHSAAHRSMAPEMAYGRHRGPAPRNAHLASVLVCFTPFVRKNQAETNRFEWAIPLTVRAKGLHDHGGQIALPGGRLERGESGWDAAKREYMEELFSAGSSSSPPANQKSKTLPSNSKLVCLGQLSPIYVYASNNQVDVFVSVEASTPAYNPSSQEVAEVILIPLRFLLSEEAIVVGTMGRGSATFEAPGFRFGDHFVWGATAMILAELVEVLRSMR